VSHKFNVWPNVRYGRVSPSTSLNARRLTGWIGQVCLGVALLLTGCATPSSPPWQKPPQTFAMAPQLSGRLAAIESQIAKANGADASGFRLLESNAEGLQWRLVLIDSATHTLDLQYYVWFGDASGQLMLSRVIAAADRGVKVRILFDDLNTMLRTMTSPELRDELLVRIDGHPNIEIRVFNAWQQRGWLGRALEGATEFERLNRRMHNKQMIADNRAAIVGGRNVGDEYMGLNAEFNFHDLDVLGVGPVARQASAVFDRYWNSDWVRRIPVPKGTVGDVPARQMIELPPAAAAHPAMKNLVAGAHSWARDLDAVVSSLHIGRSVVHTDPPSRAASSRNHMPEAFRAMMRSARRELLITNAYIIPDDIFIADLHELSARGVKVRILTNSLASHDVPAVNAHYEKWRHGILSTGADLHELRADATIRAQLVDTPPVRSAFVGLHTKAMVVDRERSFIGSMNLDPRSEIFNSEMGVIIDSSALSQALARGMNRDMTAANSWQVRVDDGGQLYWKSDSGERRTQPARGVGQRIENVLFKLMPASYY
jgi:putative cardiolipin synthase